MDCYLKVLKPCQVSEGSCAAKEVLGVLVNLYVRAEFTGLQKC